ncbi:alpha/beta fold hydrolase [Synoicihabitans lomoniglobus]|uniref:Alpha/beta fold hydrolase n=1 Tax=Synoicihabitans lomoniglobus TaxID=2909285 RepID=A0AAE9ZUS6_9BACT|nr:alpha/beta fold hydrolase [Opitutaceae bacterium LMO-M01]WED63459.1 alpha/beta fold hydrolase [Opitutaceae bacterium LMO-M01]
MPQFPRALLCLCFVVFASAFARADHHDANQKNTYVIVHGATAGAYEWKETGRYLEQAGHTVYRVTLTALGERSHLSAVGVNLTTHINDVVNTIRFEDLHDVILTGHSYGGRVITGVINEIPERIKHVMYFDASVPQNGESSWSHRPPPADLLVKDGRRIPSWLNENPTTYPHNVGHPFGTSVEPVTYDNPAAFELNVTYVPFIATGTDPDERAARDRNWQNAVARGWTVRTFPGSHTAMLENPQDLAVLMQAAVNDTNTPTP